VISAPEVQHVGLKMPAARWSRGVLLCIQSEFEATQRLLALGQVEPKEIRTKAIPLTALR
jgi:hypothetical protein